MSVTLQQFIENLIKSGLISAVDLTAFQNTLAADERPTTAKALAKQLVRGGRITKFQAAAVYAGKTRALVMGEYVVLDEIGAGGMGRVLKARHRRMERIVALKVLSKETMNSTEAIERFRQEVRTAALLIHPNIVIAYDAGEQDGVHFLVMEFVDGDDLASILRTRGPMSVDQALDCVLQTARALEYAHQEHVIHRDIKPGNLLLDRKGSIKVLDMGLARFQQEELSSSGLTNSGQVMGTVDFMSPEQANDTRTADHRSDVYSLGCTLHMLLTGRPVFEGESVVNKMMAHARREPPSLRDQRVDVPPNLNHIFRKMLAKRPEDRQQSMTEVIAELSSVLTATPAPVPAVAGSADDALSEFLHNLGHEADERRKHSTADVREENIDRENPPQQSGATMTAAAPTPPAPPESHAATTKPKPKPNPKQKLDPVVLLVGAIVLGLVLLLGLISMLAGGGGQSKNDSEPNSGNAAASNAAPGYAATSNATLGNAATPDATPRPLTIAKAATGADYQLTIEGFGESVIFAFSPDSASLFTNGVGRGCIGTYRVSDGTYVTKVKPHDQKINCIVHSRSGSYVAFGRYESATIWTRNTGNMNHGFPSPTENVVSVAISPDGKLLVAGTSEGNLRLWQIKVTNPNPPLWVGPVGGFSDSIAFSPDGKTLIGGGPTNAVGLFDAVTGKMQKQLAGHTARVRAVAYSSDGQLIASAGEDKTVRVWDAVTGGLRSELIGHTGTVRSVAFSPDGGTLASAGDDAMVILWDVANGKELTKLSKKHTLAVQCVGFSPDGKTLASSGADRKIILWNVIPK